MALEKKDFIAIEFTGRIKDNGIFDSNIKEDIEKAKLKTLAEPFIFCLGEGMFLKGVDDFLIGKEIGKEYKIELNPEQAFGLRNPKLIQIMPISVFKNHKLNAIPGMSYNFDGKLAKVLSVSGGRVRVDFNNPLAGKDVEYKIKVLKKIDNLDEKINALNKFLFKKQFKFKIENKKLILYVDEPLIKFVELFKNKFKEIFNLDLEVKKPLDKENKASEK